MNWKRAAKIIGAVAAGVTGAALVSISALLIAGTALGAIVW